MSERAARQVVKGYELTERIGSGGFGAVYRAYQCTVGREVAVKVILPSFANHPDFIRRFEMEAQLVARLEHLHIVPLYDYWRDPSGAYLVMRWLRGGSLKEALHSKPLDLASTVNLLDQIASGLSVAHRKEIVHRNLKPSNILIDEEGNGYLVDFSIARDFGQSAGILQESEGVMGSPGYLSPEQISGELVTPQSDIYSLGVLLYEMLSGTHPFPGLTPVEQLNRHLDDPLPPIETLPLDDQEGVNAVIQKATEKNPRCRYRDVLEMAAAMHQAASLAERETETISAERLTLREAEILGLIVAGQSNKQIAQDLFVELSTIKWHITQIYNKLQVRTRYQAILRAREMQLIFPGQEREAGEVSGETLDRAIDLIGVGLTNPYKGLRPFETADSRDFYGREDLVEKLVGRLAESDPYARFLAVVGPSGCGKSSLVKAGLIPTLRRGALPGSESWFIVEMEPGTQPVDNLEIALTRVAADDSVNIRAQLEHNEFGLLRVAGLILPPDNSQLLICIDQFEEVFSLVEAEALRSQFLDLLTATVSDPNSRVRVLVTLRADYYDRPLHYPDFGELVRGRMETVLPLNAQEMERAILLPAQRIGVKFEPGLAASIIEEVFYQPGALPLLQYALTELFDRREDGRLTRQAYQAIGGAVGALANRAEDIYCQLDTESQQAARQAFLQLVALGDAEDGGAIASDTRRRAIRADLLASADDAEALDELIDTYAAYRLLTLDLDPESHRPTVALAHEALIKEWERLRNWLKDSREDLLQHRRLSTLTREWQEAGQDPAYLLRQTRLDQFSAWAAQTGLRLNPQEKAFLEASQAERQALRAAEANRQARDSARERLTRRILRASVVVLLLGILSSLALAWTAEKQANLSASRELAVAAINNLEADPERSILLSLQALRTADTREAEDAMHRALPTSRVRMALTRHTGWVRSVEFSPDGKTITTTSYAWEVTVWDTGSGQMLFSLPGTVARYSPDGARLATGSLDGTVTIWDLATRNELLTKRGHTWRIFDVHFSPDGKLLVSSSADNTFIVWDTITGQEMFSSTAKVEGLDALNNVAFSPDGRLLISLDITDSGNAISFWGVDRNWALLNQLPSNDKMIFSPDGRWLVTTGAGLYTNGIVLWDISNANLESLDLSSLKPLVVSAAHRSMITNFAFSPDGSILASVGQDGLAKVWRPSSEGLELLMVLSGHTKELIDVAFSPDGTRLATGSADGSVRIWDITPAGASDWFTLAAHKGPIYRFDLTADGRYLATASSDGVAKVWDLASGRELLTITSHGGPLFGVAISPYGNLLATAGDDNIAKIWKLHLSPGAATAKLLHTLSGHVKSWPVDGKFLGLTSIAFSPDGANLVTGGVDGVAKIWEVNTGQELLSIQTNPQGLGIIRLAFSPDGLLLATTNDWPYELAKILDAASGKEISTFSGQSYIGFIWGIAFSPNGERVATSADDGSLMIWDAKTGDELLNLLGHSGIVDGVDFSPDGKYLASAGQEGNLEMWDRSSGFREELATSVALPEGTVRIWDASSGEELQVYASPSGPLFDVAFTPDGKKVIASGIGFVYGYIFDTQELIRLANSRLTRWFTLDECRQYLHQEECPPR